MRKPALCLYANSKVVDQPAQSDQELCCSLSKKYNTPCFYNRNLGPPWVFYGCTARFVSDLVGNPEYRFSLDETQISYVKPARLTV